MVGQITVAQLATMTLSVSSRAKELVRERVDGSVLVRALFAIAGFAATGCSASVVIATDATFPPFHYVVDRSGVTGFDVELARALAHRAGSSARVVVVPYEELFVGLLDGRYDLVAASTGITVEREQTYLFSQPYFDTCQVALARQGEGEPTELADLHGRRVGAAGSGTSVAALRSLPNVEPVFLSEVEATVETILEDGSVPALEQRDIDALIVDELDAVDAARRSSGRLQVLPGAVALERYGLVFAPPSEPLRDAFDDALRSMRIDGSLATLKQRFGLDVETGACATN